jgi:hypothetical protein
MNSCSLENSIRTASRLARSDNVIRKLKRSEPLSDNEKTWTLNLFNMFNFVDDSSGKVAYMLYSMNKDEGQKILDLSRKISELQTLSEEDWKVILHGVEEYRSNLIIKSRQCACGCD